jgi:hypothetical protein
MSYPYVPVEPPFKNIIGYKRAAQRLLGTGDLRADAWGVQKVSIPTSLFHGLFTYDVPSRQWLIWEDGVEVANSASTAVVSENAALKITASAAIPNVVVPAAQAYELVGVTAP